MLIKKFDRSKADLFFAANLPIDCLFCFIGLRPTPAYSDLTGLSISYCLLPIHHSPFTFHLQYLQTFFKTVLPFRNSQVKCLPDFSGIHN